MQTTIPSTFVALSSLLRADFITQWRNRRGVIIVMLVPVIIAASWKGLVSKFGGSFVLSNCITIGVTAIGLMGYANAIARDRDKGIFQRLRVAPIPNWVIMVSRLIVQLVLIIVMTTVVFITGARVDKIVLAPAEYTLGFFTAFIGGAVYLGLGQTIVGLIKNAETVNSTTRLVYFIFIMVGMFGELGVLGKQIGNIVKWSPYGTVKHIVSASLQSGAWNQEATISLLLTIVYAFTFAIIGVKNFRWSFR